MWQGDIKTNHKKNSKLHILLSALHGLYINCLNPETFGHLCFTNEKLGTEGASYVPSSTQLLVGASLFASVHSLM